MRNIELDGIDRAILKVLQQNGRLSNVELAERINLSPSACLRRVKNLEESGIIEGYVMLVNQAASGKPGNVFVQLTLENQHEQNLEAFEAAVKEYPDVMECYLMAGDEDYLLRVIVSDAADYERIHLYLTRLPGVARVKSSFALRTVTKKTDMPLT